ncbi:hypothetical protein TIFTF001_046705 [Ficus carica]|uniref:hexokinase n=1 Tax=Ficus carica TaxID=3494 RepID=A0AA88CST0_FICCA|nr:hypothetical protein TIFTF001_046705 [Ficus carica]
MSAMHHDESPDLISGCKQAKGYPRVIVELCDIVATRGARLSATGILGILKKLGRDTVNEGEKQKSVIDFITSSEII